jgi:tetratricopeptide (TPR) repeat protein
LGHSAENSWVHDLAVTLRARGYEVTHDKTSARAESTADIASLISQIVISDFFLMVVDPGYIAQVGETEGQPLHRRWAYIEYKLSEFYQDEVFRVGFMRSGSAVPRRTTLAKQKSFGEVVDASSAKNLAEALDMIFPILRDPPTADEIERADSVFRQYLNSVLACDWQRSSALALEVARAAPDSWRAQIELAVSLLRDGAIEQALDAAQRAFDIEPRTAIHRIAVAQCQIELGNFLDALALIAAPRHVFPFKSALKCLVKAQVFLGLGASHICLRHCIGATSYWPELKDNISKMREEMASNWPRLRAFALRISPGMAQMMRSRKRKGAIAKRIELDPRRYFLRASVTSTWAPNALGQIRRFDLSEPSTLKPKTLLRANLDTVILARACAHLPEESEIEPATSRKGIRDVECDSCGVKITVTHTSLAMRLMWSRRYNWRVPFKAMHDMRRTTLHRLGASVYSLPLPLPIL